MRVAFGRIGTRRGGFVWMVALVLFQACVSRSFCDLDLRAEGWRAIARPSDSGVASEGASKRVRWFTNQRGDFLACHAGVGTTYCRGIYDRFTRRADGTFERQEIVCMTRRSMVGGLTPPTPLC